MTIKILIIALIFLGGIIMGFSIIKIRKILLLFSPGHEHNSWKVLYGLMLFFLIGYSFAIWLIWYEFYDLIPILTGIIFFFGACFVLLSVNIYYHTIFVTKEVYRQAKEEAELNLFQLQQTQKQVEASLREKEVLIKEVHHRVKNNLNIIYSLLNLQSKRIKDENLMKIFANSKNRIKAMVIVHEHLYKSEDLAEIKFNEYINNLVDHLFSSYHQISDIKPVIEVEPLVVDIEIAIPCGLLINELITNSFKHAFPDDRNGEINIQLYQDKAEKLHLSIWDNGIGIAADIDWKNNSSMGFKLVQILSKQLQAKLEFDFNTGTAFHLTFPKYIQTAKQKNERELLERSNVKNKKTN